MSGPILAARIEREGEGRIRVLAPLVGTWSDHPHALALLGPGSRIGILSHLNRCFCLVLPDGAAGRLSGSPPRDRSVPVEYGQLLFELTPIRSEEREDLESGLSAADPSSALGLAPGTFAVVSPTDGMFYRRPAPDARPFVAPGDRVREGDPVGLVEVMKTFNQILYGGPGFPDEAEVVEVRCGDAEEVRAGQVLVVVRR